MKYIKSLAEHIFVAIKQLLSVNLGWKIFSLLIAVCMWFVVINITNPKEIWTFSMKLSLSGVEELSKNQNVVVKNEKNLESTVVSVKIRGNRLDLETLNKLRNEMSATANLGVIYDFTLNGDVDAPIDINFPLIPNITADSFEVISKNPTYARVTLEEIVTEERALKVTTVGDVAEGYVALAPETVPEAVNLTGPKSKLSQIDAVVLEMSLNGEKRDISSVLSPRLLDRDLKEVEGVICDTEEVSVLIKVNKYNKAPVHATTVGAPEQGYIVTSVRCEPEFLEIVGSDEDVSAFTELNLPAINISGFTQTNATTFDIRSMNILPESVSIKNGTPNAVTVTVTIEKQIEKEIELPTSTIVAGTLKSNTAYTVLDDSVKVNVKGPESLVNGLSTNNIKLSMSLDGYTAAGIYSVPVRVMLPANVDLTGGRPFVNVNVSIAENTAGTDAATAEPVPESEPSDAGPASPDADEAATDSAEAEGETEAQSAEEEPAANSD